MRLIALLFILTLSSAQAGRISNFLESVPNPSLELCRKYPRMILKKMFTKVEAKFKNPEKMIASQKQKLLNTPIRVLDHNLSVRNYLKTHRIYVSLTTSPTRIQQVHHVLETLDLSKVEKVFFSLPEKFGRTGETYNIPEWILQHPKIKVLRPAIDEGPVSKLTTAAEHLQKTDPDALLITIDDDTGFPKGMINEMIYSSTHAPNAVISGSGRDFSYWRIPNAPHSNHASKFKLEQGSLTPVDVVEGFAAIAYPVKQVPLDMIRKFSSTCKECFVSDDFVISLALKQMQVPRYRIETKYFSIGQATQYHYGFLSDSLQKGAGLQQGGAVSTNVIKYRKTYEALRNELH